MRPAGSGSLTATPGALSGPALLADTVKVTTSPTFGAGSSTDLLRERSATGTASMSVAVLSVVSGSGPWVPSSATVAVLAIELTPGGSGASTRTTKARLAVAPAPMLAMARVQVVPAGALLAQDQPALLPEVRNLVWAGTVSVTATPVASRFPVFVTPSA